MIIQNIPSSFLISANHFESRFAFSDDSRFIYVSRPNHDILVYDNKYNKYVAMKADTDYLKGIKGFKMDDSNPHIKVISQNTVILSYDFASFDFYDNGYSALLILVRLDFSNETFTMIDKIIYIHCYYSSLLKDGSQYALLHTSEVQDDVDVINECRFLLEIDENQKLQINPIIFDYNNKFLSYYFHPRDLHFHDHKIWFSYNGRDPFQRIPQNAAYDEMMQLSYFDLNESEPIKETTVDLLVHDYIKIYYAGKFLFYFPNQFEYEILNLHSKTWSTARNNIELQNFEIGDSNLIHFIMQTDKHAQYNIDEEFNVTVIDKTTKRLLVVPLKNPQTLYDIAWTTALNTGLIEQEESKLPKNLRYHKLF